MSRTELIKAKIRNIPDFPKKGIIFRDITTLLGDAEGLQLVMDAFEERYRGQKIDHVAGIEARGFILAGALADRLGVGMVTIRKKGKLPWKTVSQEYALEYGTDCVEVHVDAVKAGERVLVIDDLLATGGTSLAGAHLIEKVGGVVIELAFIVDLPDVGGRKAIDAAGYSLFTLCEFEGD